MGITDPHDRREFRQFVKLAADGSVIATTMVADGHPDPEDGDTHLYLDVTHTYPIAIEVASVTKQQVTALRTARRAVKDAREKDTGMDAAAVAVKLAQDGAADALHQDALTKAADKKNKGGAVGR